MSSVHKHNPGIKAFMEAGGGVDRKEISDLVEAVYAHAHSFFHLLIKDARLAEDIVARPLDAVSDLPHFHEELLSLCDQVKDQAGFLKTIRRYRHRSLIRIALREVLCFADIDQTCAEVSALASAIVDVSVCYLRGMLEQELGVPKDCHGDDIPFVVLGMGKLGGQELNLGSDIDLCFFYGTDDGTVHGSDESVHQWFRTLAMRIVKAISEITEDGFCFRVDLRLRPEGASGPIVNSLASAERYYETWGRTWERAAFLRASPVGGDIAFGRTFIEMLGPFIYRSEIDFTMAEKLYALVEQSRKEGGATTEDDLKIGKGGIREVEFAVQALQLSWGGKFKELQVQNTVLAIRKLKALDFLTEKDAIEMEKNWAFLRRVEHRIHAQMGYQTHRLPDNLDDKKTLALSLGFHDVAQFESALDQTRKAVHQKINALIKGENDFGSQKSALQVLSEKFLQNVSKEELDAYLEEVFPFDEPEEYLSPMRRLSRYPTAPLGELTEERFPGFREKLMHEVQASTSPKQALQYLATFFSKLGDPTSYLQTFFENPHVFRRMTRLFGTSRTFSNMLLGHPEALDEVLLLSAPTTDEIVALHDEVTFSSSTNVEQLVSFLRIQKRDFTLRIGMAFVAQEIDLLQVSELLTALADAQIRFAYKMACWVVFKIEDGKTLATVFENLPFVIVGMGKLGAGEFGFGSDLDLIFLFDEPTEPLPVFIDDMQSVCTRLTQKIWKFLSQMDSEGRGYELDARLRPSGNQGSLVVSWKGFQKYHETKAEHWEKQALIRARPIVGSSTLMQVLDVHLASIAYELGSASLKSVAHVRARIQNELAKERQDCWHPKLGFGALLDVEFLVQSLQMQYGQKVAFRVRNTLAALQRLEEHGVISSQDAEILSDAWYFFRRVEQEIRILDETYQPVLFVHRAMAELICRRLGFRDRDRMRAVQAFLDRWKRHATKVRDLFEEKLAPINILPPWEKMMK